MRLSVRWLDSSTSQLVSLRERFLETSKHDKTDEKIIWRIFSLIWCDSLPSKWWWFCLMSIPDHHKFQCNDINGAPHSCFNFNIAGWDQWYQWKLTLLKFDDVIKSSPSASNQEGLGRARLSLCAGIMTYSYGHFRLTYCGYITSPASLHTDITQTPLHHLSPVWPPRPQPKHESFCLLRPQTSLSDFVYILQSGLGSGIISTGSIQYNTQLYRNDIRVWSRNQKLLKRK